MVSKRLIIGVFLIFLFLLLATNPALSRINAKTVVVLLDVSYSVVDDAGHSPLENYIKKTLEVIGSLGKNDKIIVLAFGGKRIERVLTAVMPSVSGPMGRNLKAFKRKASTVFLKNLKKIKTDRNYTDVIGALFAAERILNSESGTNKHLYIFSDMLDTVSLHINLRRLAKKEVSSNGIRDFPDFKNTKLHCYSYLKYDERLQTNEFERAIRRLKTFWMEYFDNTKGSVVRYVLTY